MHEYSNIGRIYACSLAFTEFILRRNPSALFADFVIFSLSYLFYLHVIIVLHNSATIENGHLL